MASKLTRKPDHNKTPEKTEEVVPIPVQSSVAVLNPTSFTERASPDVAAAARELAKEIEQQRLDEIERKKLEKAEKSEKMARLTVDMTAKKHKEFKARVQENDKNLTRLVNSWVVKYMNGETEFQ